MFYVDPRSIFILTKDINIIKNYQQNKLNKTSFEYYIIFSNVIQKCIAKIVFSIKLEISRHRLISLTI